MNFEIIDFHTHPFLRNDENICSHADYCNMNAENTIKDLKSIGISKICGSVIRRIDNPSWEDIKHLNDMALKLQEMYGDFYMVMNMMGMSMQAEMSMYMDNDRMYIRAIAEGEDSGWIDSTDGKSEPYKCI